MKVDKQVKIILIFVIFIGLTGCSLYDDITNKNQDTKDIISDDKEELSTQTLFLVGDSTVCSFNDTTYYYPRAGYGTKIGDYLDTDKIIIENLALSGRSSKSFLVETNYTTLTTNISEGDFLLIGFGHNDEKAETARYTNPNTAITDSGSFKYSLYENYIKLAQDRGAIPILCTPIVRRSKSGTFSDSEIHITSDSGEFVGGDYAQAIRDLGEELGVTVIDNTSSTKLLYEALGVSESLNLHAWTSSSEASVDNTHTNVYGASNIAYLISKELQDSTNLLGQYVNDGITKPEKSILTVNPLYKEISYTSPTVSDMSSIWTTTAPWYGTVFGDCGGASKIGSEYYNISEVNSVVSMRSGTLEKSAGKIASSSDGMGVYFQQIPSSDNFTLSATATIKSIASNDQVSFGLIVRDAIWIDKFDASLLSSYVAAGPLKITKGDGLYYSSFNRVFNVGTEVSSQPSTTAVNMSTPVEDDVINIVVVKSGSDYTVTYGTEDPVKYNLDLTVMDNDYIYAGLYTARQCEVDFSNVTLTIN